MTIGSDNGLSPGRHQAIIWTNVDILSIAPQRTYQWNFIWNATIFIQENAFEHIVWEMAAILIRRGGVNSHTIYPRNYPRWSCVDMWLATKRFYSYTIKDCFTGFLQPYDCPSAISAETEMMSF